MDELPSMGSHGGLVLSSNVAIGLRSGRLSVLPNCSPLFCHWASWRKGLFLPCLNLLGYRAF
jgi:hypothetical protein